MLNAITYSPESSGKKTYWEEDWNNKKVKIWYDNDCLFDLAIPAGSSGIGTTYGCIANATGNFAKYKVQRFHQMWNAGNYKKRYAIKVTLCPNYSAGMGGGGGGGVGGGTGGGSNITSGGGDANIACMSLRKSLGMKFKKVPIALQSMRAEIINNCNDMIQDMKRYAFEEVSEIVRVCTALGIKRAYLRGLIHNINGEDDIDKYIYRFNLNGALPFQDQAQGKFADKAFFFGTRNTILLQTISVEGDALTAVSGEDISTVDNGVLPLTTFIPKYRPAGQSQNTFLPWLPTMSCELLYNIPQPTKCITTIDISSQATNPPDLDMLVPIGDNPAPYTGPNKGFPYSKMVNPIPKPLRMVMDGSPVDGEKVILSNRFELSGIVKISAGDEAVVTMQNLQGLDYPTEIKVVGNTSQLNEGDVILLDPRKADANTANTIWDFEFENPDDGDGTTKKPEDGPPKDKEHETGIPPEEPPVGDPGDDDKPIVPPEGWPEGEPPEVDSEDPPYKEPDPGDGDGEKKTLSFPITKKDGSWVSDVPLPGGNDEDPDAGSYAGEVLIQRDPITGFGSRYTEELVVGDVIELQYEEMIVPGVFYSIGHGFIHYKGTYFQKSYKQGMHIVFGNVQYEVTGQSGGGVLTYKGYRFEYDNVYSVKRLKEAFREDVYNTVGIENFAQVSTKCSLYPVPNNVKMGFVTFEQGGAIDMTTPNSMGVYNKAEEYFETGDLIAIGGIEYRFTNIYNNSLRGVYRVDGGDIGSGVQSTTLVRASKVTRAMADNEYSQAMILPYRSYFAVSAIHSDTSIEVTPSYGMATNYEGKLYRVGFNIRSTSASPDLYNSGFAEKGVAQFLPDGSATDNSENFFVPKAATEKVIMYEHGEINSTGGVTSYSVQPVKSAKGALNGKFFNHLFNASTDLVHTHGAVVFPHQYDLRLDEEEKGELYFSAGDDRYIILETMKDNHPESHGFKKGDILTIHKMKYKPDFFQDEPFGKFIRHSDPHFSAHMQTADYDDCGMLIEVADIVNPHRFKVLRKGPSCNSNADKFFHAYDLDATYYLTATNGGVLEYWAKYFNAVFLDGTVTADSENEYSSYNPTREFDLCSKGTNKNKLKWNYKKDAFTSSYKLGMTAFNIAMSGNRVTLNPSTSTADGTYIFSMKHPVTAPPKLLDVFPLRVVEFELVDTNPPFQEVYYYG